MILQVEHEAYPGPGVIINSDFLNGLGAPEKSVLETIKILEDKKLGKKQVFRLKDWGVSNRDIGAAQSQLHDENDNAYPIPKSKLPVVLPENIDINVKGNNLIIKKLKK